MSILSCTNVSHLAEFVAHMVPKIWATTTTATATHRSISFQLFCQNVIKSTQISNSCILVALLYIYKLRFAYPSIRASLGSEVRLFTTALILANKFLDDNTFTNKTWSDVSSVPLNELNIMEMEFLSALHYKTCVHEPQFRAWAAQCQHQWMSQLALTTRQHIHRKKKSTTTNYHPYLYYRNHSTAQTATSVATIAAATAMNVNFSNFIPRV